MEQSPPRVVDTHSASEATPRLVWNSEVDSKAHTGPPLHPAVSYVQVFRVNSAGISHSTLCMLHIPPNAVSSLNNANKIYK
jgi:hypothetical protein